MVNKLKIWQTTYATYGLVFRNQKAFWHIAALPMAIYYGALVIAHVALDKEFAGLVTTVGGSWLLTILSLPFIVTWYRLVLLGPNSVVEHHGLRYGRREGKFFLIFLGVYVVLKIITVILAMISGANAVFAADSGDAGSVRIFFGLLGIPIIMIIILIVFAPILRLGLVFPSVAIDQGASPRKAWILTKGNSFRFAAVLLFTLFPIVFIFDLLIMPIISQAPASLVTFLEGAIITYKYFLASCVGASALSLSYNFLTSESDNDTVSPTVSPPKPISAEESPVGEEVLDLSPDIVKPPTSKEETIIDPPPVEQTIIQEDTFKISVSVKRVEDPSLKAIVFTPLIYLLGSTAIVFVDAFTVGFYVAAFGISLEKLESFLIPIAHATLFFFFLIMTIFLVKRYSGYLFSGSWKINFYSHLKTGLKWSIPFIFVTGIGILIPETRAEWTKIYLSDINLSQENITIGNIFIFSAEILVATFLEELIFRGMIQQYIKKLVTPRISVLITAGIFTLAHFGEFLIHPVSLSKIVSWFIMGIFTGFAFNKANSCISSFIPHLVGNLEFIILVPLMLIF